MPKIRLQNLFHKYIGLLLVAISFVFSTFVYAESHALLIGVSDYEDENIDDLDGPRYDIKSISHLLKTKWGYRQSNIVTLVDEKATKRAIITALNDLQNSTSKDDHVFIYFSGHGTSKKDHKNQWPMPYGTGAIIPYDFKMSKNQSNMYEALIVGRRDLKPAIKKLDQGGRNVFVVIDACYAGQSVRSLGLPKRYVKLPGKGTFDEVGDTSGSFTRVTKKIDPYPYKNVVYISASGEHETASDISFLRLRQYPTYDNKPHGAFTDTFLRVMNGSLRADYNNDNKITYDEVYRRVRDNMASRGFQHTPNSLPELNEDKNNIRSRGFLNTGNISATTYKPESKNILRISVDSIKKFSFVKDEMKKHKNLKLVKSNADIKIKLLNDSFLFFNRRGDIISRLVNPHAGLRKKFFNILLQQYWVKQFINTHNEKQEFNVSLDLAGDVTGGTAIKGEKIAFNIRSTKAAYIVLLNIDSNGNVNVIYPYDYSELKILPANKILSIPGSTKDDMIEIVSPFGVERVVALAFTNKPTTLADIMGKSFLANSPHLKDIDKLINTQSSIWAKDHLTLTTFDKK